LKIKVKNSGKLLFNETLELGQLLYWIILEGKVRERGKIDLKAFDVRYLVMREEQLLETI
jgi:hypothetical protein